MGDDAMHQGKEENGRNGNELEGVHWMLGVVDEIQPERAALLYVWMKVTKAVQGTRQERLNCAKMVR